MGPRLKLLIEPPPGDLESCYIETALGVMSVLRSVASSRARAAAYLEDGHTFIHTSILAVEEKPSMFVFEQGPDPRLNARILTTSELTLVTSDRDVPVQFTIPAPALTQFDGADAFRGALPNRILRLQRRGYYRLAGQPILNLLRCDLVRGDIEGRTLRPAVLDISCGGLSFAVPGTEPALPKGSQHPCTLEFPVLGKIETTIEVHATFTTTLPSGVAAKRYGVEFLNLEAKHVALIQRYILDQERMKKRGR